MPMLHCAHCGYILTGLLAKTCPDCGHLYLQCPECGTPREANAIGTALMRVAQRVVARVPRFVQTFDISILILGGTIMADIGYSWATTWNLSRWDLWGLIAPWCAIVAALFEVLVFRFRGRVFSILASGAFTLGVILAGLLAAPLVTVTGAGTLFRSPPQLLWLLAAILLGVSLGAVLARQIAWLTMLLLFKKEDRQWVAQKYTAALRDKLAWRVTKSGPLVAPYCCHCGAAMPLVQADACPQCHLLKATCPACRGSTAILSAMPAADEGAELARAGWLLGLGALRGVVLLWYLGVTANFSTYRYYTGLGWISVGGSTSIVSTIVLLAPLVVVTVVAMLIVFAGRSVLAALAELVLLTSMAWFLWRLSLTRQELLYVRTSAWPLAVALATAVLTALATRALTRVITMMLPSRRMPEVEELMASPTA